MEKVEIRAFILPRNFPAVFIIFTGRGGAGNPPLPTARDGAGNPPFPAGRVPRGTGRPSLQSTCVAWYLILKEKVCDILFDERRDIREYKLDDELEDKAKDAEGR